MVVYEYKHVEGSPYHVTQTLNDCADQGWEVCGYAAFPNGDVIALVRKPNG